MQITFIYCMKECKAFDFDTELNALIMIIKKECPILNIFILSKYTKNKTPFSKIM